MSLVRKILKKQPGNFFCVSTKTAAGKWTDHWFRRNELKDIDSFAKSNKDKDIYVCYHGFKGKRRLKSHSLDPYLLYADLDEADPRVMKLQPTIAIESSPGRFVGLWLTDEIASEELNRRLSYSLGADVSGWDRTQVLRYPKTKNYKYPSTPRVKILWDDGPTYKIKDLEKKIPALEFGKDLDTEAADIYAEYEKKLPVWARRLIVGKEKVPIGQRSEVLWKLGNELIEKGMTRDEAFTVIWPSPINKFKNRRGGEDQLWRELDKALDQHFDNDYTAPSVDDDNISAGLIRPMSEIELENIDFIVPRILARGEITLLDGDPGLGKSYLAQMVSLFLCDGKKLPITDVSYKPSKGKVVYFDIENSASRVTKMRLEENGIKHQERFFQGEVPFTISDDDQFEEVINTLEIVQPDLVVFDPISTYIGSTDAYKSSEVQQMFARFKDIATRFNCAVLILRHLTKGGKDKAMYRGIGSISMVGAARLGFIAGHHPEDPDSIVVSVTKNNISAFASSFSFHIEALPDTLHRQHRSRFIWGEIHDDLNAEDIAGNTPQKNNDQDYAKEMLRQLLEKGPESYDAIKSMAAARSISKTTLNRAAAALGVEKEAKGFGKKKTSVWSLGSR